MLNAKYRVLQALAVVHLPLLQKNRHIDETRWLWRFPRQRPNGWVCENPAIVRASTKLQGLSRQSAATRAAPPMSVPHLITRHFIPAAQA